MNYQALSSKYAVAPQINPEDVTEIKADGFKAVVCNRPDGEADGQPTAASIQAACESAGLDFYYCPMNGPSVAPEHVETLRELLAGETKIFAFCRTGNRSSIFYNQATE